MTQGEEDEDIGFNVEEVQKIVRDNIELCLGGNIYSHSRTPQWVSIITEKTLSKLNKLNKPYKYIRDESLDLPPPWSCARVRCTPCTPAYGGPEKIDIMQYLIRITVTQKNGSGLHTAAAYFWDTATDGTCTVRWENKYMYCIVNIWALALQI